MPKKSRKFRVNRPAPKYQTGNKPFVSSDTSPGIPSSSTSSIRPTVNRPTTRMDIDPNSKEEWNKRYWYVKPGLKMTLIIGGGCMILLIIVSLLVR